MFHCALVEILRPTSFKMKNFLAILAVVAVFVTISEAGYSCDNWKKMDGPCEGCVFTSGDMEGKCKRTGQYFNEGNCVESGGTWCTLRLKFQSISIFLMITCA